MIRVRIVELKNRLSHHLHSVEAGAEIEVTDRDRPIARIVPVSRGTGVTVRPPARAFRSIRDRVYPPADWGVRSTDLLAEERQAR